MPSAIILLCALLPVLAGPATLEAGTLAPMTA